MGKKVSVMADLHRERNTSSLELPGGDILLLGGDIFTSPGCRRGELKEQFIHFCKNQLIKYERVLYCLGNHDYYGDLFEEAPGAISAFLAEHAPNVKMLENEVELIDGVAFIGCTLWTPCGTDTGHGYIVNNSINDFRLIYTRDINGIMRRFKVSDAAQQHRRSVEFLRKTLQGLKGKTKEKSTPCVVMTHHAPSFQSSGGPKRRGEYADISLDGAFYCNLEYIMRQNPHIKVWTHGHTHHSIRYKIEDTEIIANCHGYAGLESQGFDPNYGDFDLDDVKESGAKVKEKKKKKKIEFRGVTMEPWEFIG